MRVMRVNMKMHGTVQGVFFRAAARRMAEDLGLKGYAKNLSDGTVDIVAEGPEDKLKELIEFCRKGPKAAKVSKVDVRFEEPREKFYGFEIIY
jgi:acylphosphatase